MLYTGAVLPLAKNRLRDFRENQGLSQLQLAESLGVTRQTIISIEGGKYIPSLELALKLSKQFMCSVEDLFGI